MGRLLAADRVGSCQSVAAVPAVRANDSYRRSLIPPLTATNGRLRSCTGRLIRKLRAAERGRVATIAGRPRAAFQSGSGSESAGASSNGRPCRPARDAFERPDGTINAKPRSFAGLRSTATWLWPHCVASPQRAPGAAHRHQDRTVVSVIDREPPPIVIACTDSRFRLHPAQDRFKRPKLPPGG